MAINSGKITSYIGKDSELKKVIVKITKKMEHITA